MDIEGYLVYVKEVKIYDICNYDWDSNATREHGEKDKIRLNI